MIENQVAVVTGAASGIGRAIVHQLMKRGAKHVALVDRDPKVQEQENALGKAFVGDTTDESFRKYVFDETSKIGIPTICVPAAGIARDGLAVKINKETQKAVLYSPETFRSVLEINLIAPTYWGIEMAARIAESYGKWTPGTPLRGSVILVGSIISQGNKGQVAYAAAKKALEAVADTMTSENMFYGVRWGVVHPGYTDTPMVRAMNPEIINKQVLPQTQLKRLVSPDEIADAVCFMISNHAVGRYIWADAGWRGTP